MVTRWLPEGLQALRGIEPYEVVQVLHGPGRRWLGPASSGGIPMVVVMGRTAANRVLVVALRKDGALDQEIVGARDPRPGELAVFEQWEHDHE